LWLWAIVWPEQSGRLMYDELVLTDRRDAGAEVDLGPCGALTPRLLDRPSPRLPRGTGRGRAGPRRPGFRGPGCEADGGPGGPGGGARRLS
ncbi:DUF6758 family protein, partial [Streptomyces flavovirens]